jgi:hypothetical protein
MVCRDVRYEQPWAYYIKCVLWSNVCVIWRFWIHWFCDLGAIISNGSVTIKRTSLVGVGHSRLDSIVLLMLRTVCCAKAGALALYYRSLGIAPTLLRMGNMSGRPCIRVMTYNALAFSALKYLGNYRPFYIISLKTLKLIKWCISGGNAIFFGYYSNCMFTFINWAHVISKCEVYLLSC